MAKVGDFSGFFLCSLVLLFLNSVLAVTRDHPDKQVYIDRLHGFSSFSSGLHTNVASHKYSSRGCQRELDRSSFGEKLQEEFNGFAARLTESERERVAQMEGVVSVFPNKKLKLQTTASCDVMGLKEGKRTKQNPTVESDTIIGVFEGGIWLESESFSDKGFGPPPKKWRCVCSGSKNIICQNKLIGARY